ncbi:MAG: flagellar biosynthetic protein FliQ [Bdellovibrionales bacterium]|nr:flagellar biosynthetic protein FliQ [Bdellovibrionales bacterium]
MDLATIGNALGLVVELGVPVLAAVFVAALVVAMLQTMTQLTDDSISFIGRVAAAAFALSLFGAGMMERVQQFAATLWSDPSYFF